METFSTRVTNYEMHNCIDFDKIIEINSGGSGVIYKYECKCCKITKTLKRLRDSTQIQNFNSEVEILRIAQGHPNIITFYGVTEEMQTFLKSRVTTLLRHIKYPVMAMPYVIS
ncbi:29090_t:CDS:2 [Gigaspora margarita]|uniref:29090_t:CDS:1 n=1 Tax=Gigaspora margarita TaxID=4874 RepID=A0ABN7UQ02_GIGMA|nr:29090_t:CDS:2 [Gigaspora margarita]